PPEMSQNPLQEVELYAFASSSAQFYLTPHEFDVELVRIPAKLDTDSTPSWTRIPEQAGQSERGDAGFWVFTLLMSWGSSFCRAM
ncbi:MAG: hypothetical protein QG619_958, partial [Pseudomonadota bacterium]|nr:hypothetical protein [Pseudomonadota bacterium]